MNSHCRFQWTIAIAIISHDYSVFLFCLFQSLRTMTCHKYINKSLGLILYMISIKGILKIESQHFHNNQHSWIIKKSYMSIHHRHQE